MRFCPLKRKLRVERRFSRIAIFQHRSGLSVEAESGARMQFGPGGRDAAGGLRFCEFRENVNNFYEK